MSNLPIGAHPAQGSQSDPIIDSTTGLPFGPSAGGGASTPLSLPFVPLYLAAALLLFWLSDYAPMVVNGLLAVILVGMVVKNASVWQGAIAGATSALQQSQA